MPDRITGSADFKKFVDGYDGAIRFMDDQIGQLFQTLAGLGVLDETAVIISADHGEAMGEQGIYGDHVCAGEAVHHIPMIIRWPGATPDNTVYQGLLYNVDLQPTLCDLLNLPVPSGWDGHSFVEAVRGNAWAGRPSLVWDHALYSCQRAVRTPRWLFIRTFHPGLYPFAEVMLFDMQNDPHQIDNLALEKVSIRAHMEQQLNDWLQATYPRRGYAMDPLQNVIASGPWKYVKPDEWLRHLRGEDRVDEAKEIEKRLAVTVAYTGLQS